MFPLIAGALASLIANLPLSWIGPVILPEGAASAPGYQGTIWHGQISGINFLDRVTFQTHPLNLFSDRPLVAFSSQADGISLSGDARPGHISNFTLRGTLTDLPLSDGRLAGMNGTVNITVETLRYEGKTCNVATGRFESDFLLRNRQKLNWTGPNLSGPVSCEGGLLVLRITGQDDVQDINGKIDIDLAGHYRAEIDVRSNLPEAAVVLPLYGFEANGRQFSIVEQGVWQ